MKSAIGRAATFISLTILLSVVGCKTTDTPIAGKAIDSLSGMRTETEDRLSTAASNAIAEGKTDDALALYQKLYDGNKNDPMVVINYAQLLRKTGHAQQAVNILAPMVEAHERRARPENKSPLLLNEYAAANIEVGNFEKAEELLNRVLEDTRATRFHADAYNLLGVVLDAKNQHREAEESYRQALQDWKGDPTSVMNNLGLCLASQGRFDESLLMLRQALVQAPQKEEIARNIEMVANLRQSVVPAAPIDVKKK